MRALRRSLESTGEDGFPNDVLELQAYLATPRDDVPVRAVPGQGTEVPIWLLGSSLFSAQLAAERGLPYAFASHFAPRMLMQAIDLYRSQFRPSAQLRQPHVVVGVPLVAAPTDAEAEYLASSNYQRVLGIVRGERGRMPPPVDGFMASLGPSEQAAIRSFLAMAVIGGPDTVRRRLQDIVQATEADELMLVCDTFDPDMRLRSLSIAAEQWRARV